MLPIRFEQFHSLLSVFDSFFFQTQDPNHELSVDPNENSTRFWIESSVQMALATLINLGIFNVRVINHAGDANDTLQGLLEVEEIQSPITRPIPVYICNFETYNEKDCRAICREIAICIKRMHEAGIAHRNLHLGNIEIDPFVSSQIVCVIHAPLKSMLNFLFELFIGKSQFQRANFCAAHI